MARWPPKQIPGDSRDPHGFPAMVAEFCEWMAIRGYSPNTVKTRHLALAKLAEWLAERSVTRPAEVNEQMLDGYQRALYYKRKEDGKPLSFTTQAHRLTAVRGFFGWLARTNRILYDPAATLELPREGQRLPRAVLSAAEAERVLALPDIATPLGLRDRAMLELFYATGVRRAELSNLAVFDLDIERRALMVREGKGRKDRLIPTGERAAMWCERYLTEARPELAAEPDEAALFLTSKGLRFNVVSLSRLIGSYIRQAGINKPGACHIFRHTMATLMLEGGADIRYVQQMLGHSSIESTQVYTRVSLRALEGVHSATHPGAANKPRSARLDEGAVGGQKGGDRGRWGRTGEWTSLRWRGRREAARSVARPLSSSARGELVSEITRAKPWLSGRGPTVRPAMAEKRLLRRLTANVDAVDVVFGLLPGLARYAAFVSWADVIVRAIRGEEAKENWKTFTSTGLLIGVWTLTSGARVREMASLRGAAVKMRSLVHDAAAQSELRDQRAAERDHRASQQEARMLSLTKWLVALAGLTLTAAIVTLVVAIAQ